jgi:hypothetical protein
MPTRSIGRVGAGKAKHFAVSRGFAAVVTVLFRPHGAYSPVDDGSFLYGAVRWLARLRARARGKRLQPAAMAA